jgi:hypothetical protein
MSSNTVEFIKMPPSLTSELPFSPYDVLSISPIKIHHELSITFILIMNMYDFSTSLIHMCFKSLKFWTKNCFSSLFNCCTFHIKFVQVMKLKNVIMLFFTMKRQGEVAFCVSIQYYISNRQSLKSQVV